MYNYCTKEPYLFLMIDRRPTATIPFKKNFDEPIDLIESNISQLIKLSLIIVNIK